MSVQIPTPPWSRPLIAVAVTGSRRGPSLVALRKPPADAELRALLTALHRVRPDDPTQCEEWSAHDLVAHLAAGSREMAELLESPTPRATREFTEREEPYRRMSDRSLRRAFVVEGLRLISAIERRRAPVEFTGATLSVNQVVAHVRSELVLHRFDLTGGDRIDRVALSDPALAKHARTVVAGMDAGVLPPTSSQVGTEPLLRTLQIWGRRAPEHWALDDKPTRKPVTGDHCSD